MNYREGEKNPNKKYEKVNFFRWFSKMCKDTFE